MSLLEVGNDKNTPVLTSLSEEAVRTTVVDLFNPEHIVNCKSMSGKRAGMSVIIDGHTWVAEGSRTDSGWYRNQKHVEEQTAILRARDNTSLTPVVATSPYVPVVLDDLSPVEVFFAGNWVVDSSLGKITYTGAETIFTFLMSGDITTSDSSGTGDTIHIEIFDSSANEGLTGATKTHNVAKVQGGVLSVVDFTLTGAARVVAGDYLQIRTGANFTGELLANNILLTIKPLDTLMYS